MVHQVIRPASDTLAGLFFVIGKCFRPDRRAAGVAKASRTVGGPAMQAPTSKGQGFHKNISLFCDSIVGASIALPLRPCAAARLVGWSRAPPLLMGRESAYVIISTISQFRSRGRACPARICRSCNPPKYSPAPLAGLRCRPLQAKGKVFAKIYHSFVISQ